MAISDKIQQVMKERNISYAELSRITGIAPSSMQSYGSGRSKKVPFHIIETLSEKLHLPIEYWFQPDETTEVIPHVDAVSPALKEMLDQNATQPTERSQFLTELLSLAELYQKGLLTEEEFAQGKKFLFEMTK